MANKLKAITAKAKQLYKAGKYKKWTDAIKAASKSLPKKTAKKKSISGWKKGKTRFVEVGEKTKQKKNVVRVHRRKKEMPGTFKGFTTIGSMVTDLSKKYDFAIKHLATVKSNIAFYKEMAKKDSAKKKYYNLKAKEESKKVANINKIINALKKSIVK